MTDVSHLEERAERDLAKVKALAARHHSLDPVQVPLHREPEPLAAVPLHDFMQAELPASAYCVYPIIPKEVATLLAGHGGAGKSVLAAVIAAHVACGWAWGPFPVQGGRVAYASLEDPGQLVKVRLRRIVEQYGLPPEALKHNLMLLDGSDGTPDLLKQTDFRTLVEGVALHQLREMVTKFAPSLLIIDNASDAYGADENNRAMVRQFIRTLAKLGRSIGAGVLLLSHLDKMAAKGQAAGQNYSGSTAWHNSVRSRLALVSEEGQLQLLHEKLNLGKTAAPVLLGWTDHGVLVPMDPADVPARTRAGTATTAADDDRAVLAAIKSVIDSGGYVPRARSGGFTAAHALREVLPLSLTKGKGLFRFWAAMDRLRVSGSLAAEEFKTANRKVREQWVIASSPGIGATE